MNGVQSRERTQWALQICRLDLPGSAKQEKEKEKKCREICQHGEDQIHRAITEIS